MDWKTSLDYLFEFFVLSRPWVISSTICIANYILKVCTNKYSSTAVKSISTKSISIYFSTLKVDGVTI